MLKLELFFFLLYLNVINFQIKFQIEDLIKNQLSLTQIQTRIQNSDS